MKKLSEETRLAVIANNIEYIKRDVTEIKKRLDENYITRAEFDPIKKVVYGLVGILLVATVSAILRLIFL